MFCWNSSCIPVAYADCSGILIRNQGLGTGQSPGVAKQAFQKAVLPGPFNLLGPTSFLQNGPVVISWCPFEAKKYPAGKFVG